MQMSKQRSRRNDGEQEEYRARNNLTGESAAESAASEYWPVRSVESASKDPFRSSAVRIIRFEPGKASIV
jgi:hypothetical protein